MFCLLYLSNQGPNANPQVCEISKNKSTLLNTMQELAFQQCVDEVGRKNYVNTLDEIDLSKVEYPVYPNCSLKKGENAIQVYRIEKKSLLEKGYIYNSVKEYQEIQLIGCYHVCEVQRWKYENLLSRPTEETIKTNYQKHDSDTVNRNYDRVILQLIEAMQKKKKIE